jgi:hypothetical protein
LENRRKIELSLLGASRSPVIVRVDPNRLASFT